MDFQDQPIEKHLARAKFLGVKYLVIRTPKAKEKLSKVSEIKQKYDFGWWSIYELPGEPDANPTSKILKNRPALVVSNFTLKARYQNDLSYIRFIEEQFSDSWFDVLLARSPEIKIDRLSDWENFGAVIINDYQYGDENQAFENLKEIANKRLVILISSEDRLFQRIKQSKSVFPKLEIIEHPKLEGAGKMLNSNHPTFRYNGSPIRQLWAKIRQVLETNKIPVESNRTQINSQKSKNQIQVDLSSQEKLPTLITNTFHPSWHRTDNETIYPVTPFYQLTFANQPIELKYERNSIDKASLWISALALIGSLALGFLINLKHGTKHISDEIES